MNRTLKRMNYRFCEARRKGVLTKGDQIRRLKFARDVSRDVSKFRTNKDRQTAYSVILFCVDVCFTAQIRSLKSGYFGRVNVL